ncbi:hypothetical protein SS50377_23774 [Spironucleus salmonicida]|uniref:Uncharacterized protein n=1 Tax=Spironucleus salmonicida TaxID=348837 RepID=V6LP46_9EUKA|nr:hypothetical protein SS50377_23774 [Spironucleus salmonicida]|eukprot:EST46452.1 Hypothetical protein SS50377_13536 [Spironucleus salmonicida]
MNRKIDLLAKRQKICQLLEEAIEQMDLNSKVGKSCIHSSPMQIDIYKKKLKYYDQELNQFTQERIILANYK